MKWSIAASPMKRSRNNRMLTSIRPTLVLIIALAFVMGSNREMPGAESFLELNFQRFDQNMDGGWRISAKTKKYAEAAKMIEVYLAKRRDVTLENRRMLHFHAGQTWAMTKQGKNAIAQRDSGKVLPEFIATRLGHVYRVPGRVPGRASVPVACSSSVPKLWRGVLRSFPRGTASGFFDFFNC